jgi:hypothetical protein
MITAPPLKGFGKLDKVWRRRGGFVEMANATLGDHRFGFSLKSSLKTGGQVHFESIGILNYLGIN